ncbi:hypothetical protein FPRO04_09918 [Fusarium proliferatum]|nr:hypothetical protein FPRO04_09918 [Fusarium proliferatum]
MTDTEQQLTLVLTSFLSETQPITAPEAATKINNLFPHQPEKDGRHKSPGGFLAAFWDIAFQIAVQLDYQTQQMQSFISLIKALRDLPSTAILEDGRRLWQDLPDLSLFFTERWNQAGITNQATIPPETIQHWINLNGLAAYLTIGNLYGGTYPPKWAMCIGLAEYTIYPEYLYAEMMNLLGCTSCNGASLASAVSIKDVNFPRPEDYLEQHRPSSAALLLELQNTYSEMMGLQGLGIALLLTGQVIGATIPSESPSGLEARGMPARVTCKVSTGTFIFTVQQAREEYNRVRGLYNPSTKKYPTKSGYPHEFSNFGDIKFDDTACNSKKRPVKIYEFPIYQRSSEGTGAVHYDANKSKSDQPGPGECRVVFTAENGHLCGVMCHKSMTPGGDQGFIKCTA